MIAEMESRVRLPASFVTAGLVVLLVAAAVHLKISSRRIEERRNVKRWSRPRLPVHPADPSVDPSHRAWRETMDAVERLRTYFADSRNHPGGVGPGSAEYEEALRTIAKHDLEMLNPLERIVLDENEAPFVRGALLDVIARRSEEAVRQFLAGLVADPREHEYLRSKALDHLSPYDGEATFRVLSEVYDLEPEFPDRHRLVLAVAGTRSARAVPLLLGALDDREALEVRCAAAQGLEKYLDHPGVRERLFRVARGGGPAALRRNAIAALASRADPEVEALLRSIAESGSEPEEIRRVARAWLERRP